MTRDEYMYEVNSVLDAHRHYAVSRLRAALAFVPPEAKRITLDIFVDQDGEGFLDVRVGLDGPDLYVLNKAIELYAQIFETRMTETGLAPPLPLMDAFGEEFSVHDALTDCAASWIESVWQQLSPRVGLPVMVQAHEGYGTFTPIKLN
jgi:hypothetical protein